MKAKLPTEPLLSIGVDLTGAQAGGNIAVSDVRVGYTPEVGAAVNMRVPDKIAVLCQQ